MHSISWNIDRVFFTLPWLNISIYWYGLFFALGVFLAQKGFTKQIMKEKLATHAQLQNFLFVAILSMILCSRLYDILFYQDPLDYFRAPLEIFDLRSGGLSSHGGLFGFMVALVLCCRSCKWSFFAILKSCCAPVGIMACFIRIGNFFNQEILGRPYEGFGSVIFQSPFDHSQPVARHPVVIYEALFYLFSAWLISRMKFSNKKICGLSLLFYFVSRIGFEYFKEEQSIHKFQSGISMGMLLSIPFIVLGLIWIFDTKKDKISLEIS